MGLSRIILADGAAAPAAAIAATPEKPTRPWLPWIVATAAFLVALAILLRPERLAPPKPLVRLRVDVGAEGSLARSRAGNMLALSPDGTRLAVTFRGADGKTRLGTRLLHQERVTALSAAAAPSEGSR